MISMYRDNCVTVSLIRSFNCLINENGELKKLVCTNSKYERKPFVEDDSHFHFLFETYEITDIHLISPETGDMLYSMFRLPESLFEMYLIHLSYERLRIQNG